MTCEKSVQSCDDDAASAAAELRVDYDRIGYSDRGLFIGQGRGA